MSQSSGVLISSPLVGDIASKTVSGGIRFPRFAVAMISFKSPALPILLYVCSIGSSV